MYIHLTDGKGNPVKPDYKYAKAVKTLKRTVTVIFHYAHIYDDGDDTNCGELVFDFDVEGFWARKIKASDDDPTEVKSTCSGDDFSPFSPGSPYVTVVAKDVKDDVLTVKMMAVDLDYDAGLPGNGNGLNGYGGARNLADSVDWSEGVTHIPVGPKAFSTAGENYMSTKTESFPFYPGIVTAYGSPEVTWYFQWEVQHG
jgi:hypothetical protein